MRISGKKPLFGLGQLLTTPGAWEAFRGAQETPLQLLERHSRGDWGDVGKEDWEANNRSLVDGSRLFSSYTLSSGVKIWIITEGTNDNGEREATTFLLPSEY